jgi:catechol 2,3-dioxygenase-like lactoylglutathione lyase family enzyme
MVRVTTLDHLVLQVTDVERSLAFYEQRLGLAAERVEAWRRGEVRFPSVRINEGIIIDLVQDPTVSSDRRTNLGHFCLVTDSEALESVVNELRASEIPIERGPVSNWGARGEGRSIYFRDPDDNLIELRTYVGVDSPSSGKG